jgi:hypothetical protein
MDDVRRWDRQILNREVMRPRRVFWGLVALFWAVFIAFATEVPFVAIFLSAIVAAVWIATAKAAAAKARFRHPRFRVLWEQAHERLDRFDQALVQSRKAKVAEFEELPRTVRAVGQGLYLALRRADMVFGELVRSEGALLYKDEIPHKGSPDAQANELYRVADRNVAEYKQQVRGVLAGVERTEAQVAVFTSTLDTLRVKLLSYRLTGRSPEMQSKEFLDSIVEAKMQFESIDKALEELEMTPWPVTVATVPPPLPEDPNVRHRLGGGH